MVDIPTKQKAIRGALRKIAKKHGLKYNAISVRNDRGTAWGWTKIYGSEKWGKFTEAEEEVLKEFGLVYGHGGIKTLINPDTNYSPYSSECYNELDSYYGRALEILDGD